MDNDRAVAFGDVANLAPGMQVRASGPQGARLVTVVRVDRDFVTVDGNHPLAGRTLHFSVEVADVAAEPFSMACSTANCTAPGPGRTGSLPLGASSP